MSTKEEIYDERIAPILLEAGKVAKQHSIDLLAYVDISSDEQPYGAAETRCIDMSNAHAAMRLVQFAIAARGNVDAMMIALAKDQEGKPHNSLVLTLLEHDSRPSE